MPSHTNGTNRMNPRGNRNRTNNTEARYRIVASNKPYNGRVVKIGNFLFTTNHGGIEGGRQQVEEVSSNTPRTGDIVTQFRVGDGSTFGSRTYTYDDGRQVASGVRLHHHTIPPIGRSNFMTQHTMDGNEQDVFTRRQSGRISNTRRQATPSRTRTATRATNQRTGGMGRRGTMGGGSGGGGSY